MHPALKTSWPWRCWLALLATALSSQGARESAWFARRWHTEDGLPEHNIVALEQTRDGYLWLATNEGLYRFDGLRFHEFTPAKRSGHPGSQLRLMLRDRQDRLWLAKDRGSVFCISQGELTHLLDLEAIGFRGQARSLVEDAEGNIWVSDSAGSVLQIRGQESRNLGRTEGLDESICRLTTDIQGRLWFTQSGNTGVFREDRFVSLVSMDQPARLLARAREGGVWLNSGLKLYHYQEGGELKAVAQLSQGSAPPTEVTVVYEDRSHGLWIGTSSGGLLRYDAKGGLQTVASALPAISAILEDFEGNLWVSARGGGLSRYRPRAAELFGPADGLPFVAMRSTLEDATGCLWAVGENGALARETNGVWRLVSNDGSWEPGRITCLAQGANGEILLGTQDHGVWRHASGAFSKAEVNQALTNLYVRSLHVARNGDLWIGPNSGQVLCRWRNGELKMFPLPANCINVRTIAEGADFSLWAAGSSRLLHITGEVIQDETDRVIKTSRTGIRSLFVAGDGSLFIGFSGQGLGWFKDGNYFEFHTVHGLYDQYVSQVIGDDQGRVWLGGNRGIFQVAQSELLAVASGRAQHLRSVVVGRGEGLPNLQAAFGVWPLGSRCQDGRLLMPTLSGLVVIQPESLRGHPTPPPVVIEDMRVNGQSVAAYDIEPGEPGKPAPDPANLRTLAGPLQIAPGVQQMQFDFTALSLSSPENVSFRYKLEGLDPDWVDAGATRFAPYTRVPPGDYRFRVTACGHDGVWSETGASLAFSVQPDLWEITWVRVAGAGTVVAFCSGAALVSVRRRYRRKIERLEQRQALERERARIAQDLHDDLGAGLVEINFGSELARDPSLGIDEVREHMREIGTRAKGMVTALDEIVWAVNPKQDSVSSLATYFCQYAQHFLESTPMRCHLDVDRNLPPAPLNAEQRHSLFLAYKEALSNAVQHSGGTDLTVHIAAAHGHLTIRVSDNGRGFDPSDLPQPAGADGLGNMKRRLQQLGGACVVSGKQGQGTTVTLSVPLTAAPKPHGHNSVELL